MANPLNPEAGEVPAPTDERDRQLAERSARVIWRAFPYFAWRYGERGRSFGRSDAGYLVTLLEHDEATARIQVAWLAGLLAPRGMPSMLLEVQLESLGRIWRRERAAADNRFLVFSSEMRAARWSALDEEVFEECERLCRAASNGDPRRRGAGKLIAASVADRAIGIGQHDEGLVRWLCEAAQGEAAWSEACASARALALRRCRRAPDASP